MACITLKKTTENGVQKLEKTITWKRKMNTSCSETWKVIAVSLVSTRHGW